MLLMLKASTTHYDRGTVVLYVYVNYAVSMYVRIWYPFTGLSFNFLFFEVDVRMTCMFI